ncbi:hypothetical protein [Flavobacterium sp. B183]|uniref:hypothetical protein n=1 Tax=Flavobacterium sp. B183 TaxID=907046 RepID=UPI00201F08AF|nr:hypothetical protein [Flavobacterium sp. B183]URC13936.1 hypothetical protein M4I44_05940 [Flavobacterium sp. B183]URC14042.1 hypothetical protein M4I44_06540 [Flavobacterium sp. B183]
MNRSNFNQTGGFPLKTERLQELQTAFKIFESFGQLAGDLTIISGCELVGTTVTNGVIFINGEPIDFREASVTMDSKVIIIEEPVNRAFENGTVKEVHSIRYATFGTADVSWPWSSFIRPPQTKELAGIFQTINASLTTINTSLTTIRTKLDTIQEGAKVQVQADMNQTDSTKPDFVKNKVTYVDKILHAGELYIGDVFDEDLVTITFGDVGTNRYIPLVNIYSEASDWSQDANTWLQTRDRTSTSFKVILTELVGNKYQKISLHYVLIRL